MSNEATVERQVVEDLLASAREHFLKYGYDKASLRKICASAGVTTGALYFSFKNKEALFDALVGPTMKELDSVIRETQKAVLDRNGEGFDENAFNDFIFRFLIENREGVQLLVARAEGSHYEGFYSKLHSLVETLMSNYAKKVAGVPLDPDLVSILTNMYFSAISELISRDYDYDRMMLVAKALRACMEHGFEAMLEQQKEQG